MTVPPAARAAIDAGLADHLRRHGVAATADRVAAALTTAVVHTITATGWAIVPQPETVPAPDAPGDDTPRRGRPHRRHDDRRILQLVAADLTNAAIARTLHISDDAAKSRVARLIREYGARTRTGLVVRAVAAGHITLAEAGP